MKPNAFALVDMATQPRLVGGMKIAAALIGGLLVLSGCASIGPKFKTVSADDGGRGQVRKSASEMADAMAGGLIGGSLGGSLSAGDRRKALEAEYRALEYGQSGQAVAWTGKSDGRSGTVVPAQPYRVGSQDCRQYSHTVTIDGESQSARGTACRNPDGSWTTLS